MITLEDQARAISNTQQLASHVVGGAYGRPRSTSDSDPHTAAVTHMRVRGEGIGCGWVGGTRSWVSMLASVPCRQPALTQRAAESLGACSLMPPRSLCESGTNTPCVVTCVAAVPSTLVSFHKLHRSTGYP